MRREERKTGKLVKNRGFTDKLYFYNFCTVHILMAAILTITALGGLLGLADLSPLGSIPQWAYTELGIHTGFVIWKAKTENARKYPAGRDGAAQMDDPAVPDVTREMKDFEESEKEL